MNSISRKVLAGYLLVLIVAVAASITLFRVVSEVNMRTNNFVGGTLPELNALQQGQQSLARLQISAYSLYGTMIKPNELNAAIDADEKYFKQLLMADGLLASYPGRESIEQEVVKLISIMLKLQQVMAAENVDWDKAREVLHEIDMQSKSVGTTLDKMKNNVSLNASQSAQMISSAINNIEVLVLSLLASIAVVAVVAYGFTRKKIALPIRELASELDYVSQHYDLTKIMPQYSNDETGIAAQSVNSLLSAFKSGINDVRYAAQNINNLVSVLGISSIKAEEQVRLLNEKIESVLSEMIQLETQIEQGFQHSYSASEKAKQGAQEVQNGAEEVAKTSAGIAKLARDIEVTSEMLLELRTSGDHVSSVVATIASIAEQTNLLALNAAIEAARAGESGRGFAVVADEVRTLATRTRQSTTEINSMLEGIVNSISQAVSSLENNQQQADQAVVMAEKTVDSLSLIQSTILTLSNESSEVAEQTECSHHQVVDIRAAIEHFKTIGNVVCQSSMETKDTSEKMTELAVSFNQSVERFRT